MENVHIHLFPAVGSLKEKRMCFAFDAAPHNTAANEAATAADGLNEATADLAAADAAHDKINAAHTKVREIETTVGAVVDAGERAQMNATLDAIRPRVKQAKETFERKMAAIVTRNAAAAAANIMANAAAVANPEGPFVAGMDRAKGATPVSAPLVESYADAMRVIIKAKVDKNAAEAAAVPPRPALYPGAALVAKETLPAAVTDLAAKRAEAMEEDAKARATPGYLRKVGVLETNVVVANYRNALVAEQTNARNALTTAAAGAANIVDKMKAADKYAQATTLLAALETAEAARVGTAPTTGPGGAPTTAPAEIPATARDAYNAVVANKDKPLAELQVKIDELNTKLTTPESRIAAVNALTPILTNYNVVLLPAAGSLKVSLLPKGTPVSAEVENANTIREIVRLILQYVGIVLPTNMSTLGALDTAKIDDKIATLTASRTGKTGAELAAIDQEITYLRQTREIVVQVDNLKRRGLDVNVEVDSVTGKLKFTGRDRARIESLLVSGRIPVNTVGGALEIDRIDPRVIALLLRALQQLAVAYRPGVGAGYVAPSYPGAYAFNGAAAGFDQGNNPYAMVGQGAFVNKPVADYGSSNRTSRA